MAKQRKLYQAFAGGELSPEMYGHAEDTGYQIGVATMLNAVPLAHGPAKRRPGFEYIADAGGGSLSKSRVIPFVFSTNDTLVVEIAVGFFRFIDSSGIVNINLSSVAAFIADETGSFSVGSPASGEITLGTNNYIGGERVQVSGTVPLPLEAEVDYYIVYTLSTEIKLSTFPGGPPITGVPDTGSITVHRYYARGEVASSGGTNYYCTTEHLGGASLNTAYWYELPSTGALKIGHSYREQDLFEIGSTQSADVLTMVHPLYPPVELARFGDTEWTLRWINFNGNLNAPTGVEATATYGRKFEIEDGAFVSPKAYLYFQTPHEMSEGDGMYLEGVTGFGADPDDGYYVATDTEVAIGGYAAGHVLAIKETDTGNYYNGVSGSSLSGGTMRYTPLAANTDEVYVVTAIDENFVESDPSSEVTASDNVLYVEGSYNTITWLPVLGAKRYRIYKQESGIFGYIGQVDDDGSASYSFKDDNLSAQTDITPGIRDTALSPYELTVTNISEADPAVVEIANHGLKDGDPVWFTSLTASGGSGVDLWKRYLVGGTISNNAFQLYNTDGTTVPVTGGTYSDAIMNTGDFPGAVAYFQQRRIFAGSRNVPQGFWMTRSGTESDLRYSLPLKADDRISGIVSARQASTIKHIVPMHRLAMLSTDTEYAISGPNDEALTPTVPIPVHPQSGIGASQVTPQVVNNTIVFCEARGGHVREMGYQAAAQGFVTGDLSLRAAHLFDNDPPVDSAQSKSPYSVLWFVTTSGKLLSLTYVPEESVGAWAQHETGDENDKFISVAVIPEGDEDRVYCVIDRNGTYTIEKMAAQDVTTLAAGKFVDSFYSEDSTTYAAGAVFPAAVSTAIDHLSGRTVSVLVDGVVYPDQTVTTAPNSTITMPVATTGTQTVTVGLPYTTDIKTMPFTAQVDGLGHGRRKNVNKVWVRVAESAPFQVGPSTNDLSATDPWTERAGALTTAEIDVTLKGDWTDDGQIVIRQSDPLPLTVVSATTLVTLGG